MNNKIFLYAVRDATTGKLVTNITKPGHKFWEKKGNCLNAIKIYNYKASGPYGHKKYEGPLELVTFELKEVVNND
jgi:hypothetical protein